MSPGCTSVVIYTAGCQLYVQLPIPLAVVCKMRTPRFNGRFTQVRIAQPLTAVHFNP